MAWFVKVSSNDVIIGILGHIVEVSLKSVHQSTFGLTHILHPAYLACYTIYEVGRLATHIVFGDIVSLGYTTGDLSSGVDLGTISAVLSFADISDSGFVVVRPCWLGYPGLHQKITKVFWSTVAMFDMVIGQGSSTLSFLQDRPVLLDDIPQGVISWIEGCDDKYIIIYDLLISILISIGL